MQSVRKVIAAWIIQDHDIGVCTREELQENACWYQQPLSSTAKCENNTLVDASHIWIVK
jgi:hypothetical protein